MKHVFISYVHEDRELVGALCDELRQEGVAVWLDREQIHPGQRWREAIRHAIREGAFFIACFSEQSAKRERAYMNEELTLAIEEIRCRPTTRAWFVPVLLSDDALPDRDIGAGETLRDIQWLDLSDGPGSSQWRDGVRRLTYLVKHVDPLTPGTDFSAQVQASVQRRDENALHMLLKATARETIDCALEAFIRDKNTEEYGFVLRPVCSVFGNQFTATDVVRLVTRGGIGNSRTGFHGLDTLYDEHFDHVSTLGLAHVFRANNNPIIAFYCMLRERFPRESVDSILWNHKDSLRIDGMVADPDYYFDKFPNRGTSAFLDSVARDG